MPTYFMSPYSPVTWDAARQELENSQAAFAESQLKTAKKLVSPGDVFLCYIIGEKEIVAALRATSGVTQSNKRGVLKLLMFPVRFDTEIIARVERGEGVSLSEIKERSAQPRSWISLVQGALKRVPPDDAEWIIKQLKKRSR